MALIEENNAKDLAHDFFEQSKKDLIIPSGKKVIIKKINVLSFLNQGTLPVGSYSSKKKGIIQSGKNPREIMIDRIREEMVSLGKQAESTDDINSLIDIDNKYSELENKLNKIESEKLVIEQRSILSILSSGLYAPLISVSDNPPENHITIDDLSVQDVNFLVTEIMKFSGLSGEDAEKLSSFRGES